MKKYDVFIVTKPLQYLNATNISTLNKKNCLLVNNFKDANLIYKKISELSNYWSSVFYFEKSADAYLWVIKNKGMVENLYIDSDYGVQKHFYLVRLYKHINIFVYEEGIGNYKGNLNNNSFIGNLKKTFNSLLGNKDFLGGSKYVKGIFLYDCHKHRIVYPNSNKKLFHFDKSFLNHISDFSDSLFLSIFL